MTHSNQPHSDAAQVPPGEAALASLCLTVAAVSRKLDQLHDLLATQRKAHYVVHEVSQLTGRSEYTVRRWITEGRLKAIRLAEGGPRGRLLVERAELERLISSGKGGGIPDSAIG